MNEILKTTLVGLFFGTFGTTIGGLLGVLVKPKSNKFLGFILSCASGLMISIVCFDLIPEAMKIGNFKNVIFGMLFGIISIIICDILVQKKFNMHYTKDTKVSNLLKTGIVISVGIALHNFPEGLAIGSGFDASIKLGYSLAIAIALHDIPEGMSMAIPMKNGGMNTLKVILYVVLSGVTTGIGALFGAIIGTISNEIICICLAFAAGAMLYIVSGELIPESNNLYKGRMNAIGNIIGFILGLIAQII